MARFTIIPGLYEVSNKQGRIRSLNYLGYGKTEILKQNKTGGGYLAVSLTKNGKTEQFKVHRVVAEVFIPNPGNLPEVNHINENKHDNSVENLEWCTRQQNVNHGTCQQRRAETIRGAKHPQAKKVRCIETKRVFDTVEEACRWCKIKTGITNCCKGKQKTAGGYTWEYVEEEV